MIINDIRPIMKAAQPGVADTWDNLYAFFLNRVRDNLHVMLCFSPVGNKFSTRAQQFPGLINGCTIDWFLPWPEEALTSGGFFMDMYALSSLLQTLMGGSLPSDLSAGEPFAKQASIQGKLAIARTTQTASAAARTGASKMHFRSAGAFTLLVLFLLLLQCLESSLMSSRWPAARKTAPS